MIFPADAGVNPWQESNGVPDSDIPRGCGGEPEHLADGSNVLTIFPADAGVNRGDYNNDNNWINIPRGCGGEPKQQRYIPDTSLYSPRMRG